MTGHHESTGPYLALSGNSVHRVSQYQTAGVNARLRLLALLETQGVPVSEADDLVAAVEAGAQSEAVELDGMAPASRGPLFADGWDEGVTAVSEALVGIAGRDWSRRGGRSAGSAQLSVHLADVRQRERAGLVRLEGFRPRERPAAHHGAAAGAGGAGRGRRSVHGADAEHRRGRRLHA
ncbi:hypothetical protein [Streptomyces sp. NPDC096030]|uniref:hypothetical protein n=1 Tax=Streptomyces sp. NPDC096030 TaxID=3155423 RepID=UPI00332F79DA